MICTSHRYLAETKVGRATLVHPHQFALIYSFVVNEVLSNLIDACNLAIWFLRCSKKGSCTCCMVEVAMGNQNQISIIRRTNLSFRIHLKWAFWVALKPWINVDYIRVAFMVKL